MPVQGYVFWAFLVGVKELKGYKNDNPTSAKELVPIFRMAAPFGSKGVGGTMKLIVGYRHLVVEAMKSIPKECDVEEAKRMVKNAEVKVSRERRIVDWDGNMEDFEDEDHWSIDSVEGDKPPFKVTLCYPFATLLCYILGQIRPCDSSSLIGLSESDPNCYMLRSIPTVEVKKRGRPVSSSKRVPRRETKVQPKSPPPPSEDTTSDLEDDSSNVIAQRAYPISRLGNDLTPEDIELIHLNHKWTSELVVSLIEKDILPPLHSVDSWIHSHNFVKVQCTFVHFSGELVRDVWLPLGFLKREYARYVSHIASK